MHQDLHRSGLRSLQAYSKVPTVNLPPDPARAKRVIFVSSHRRHRKVADRITGAIGAHCLVELYAFERGEVDNPVYADPAVSHVSLGPVRDGVALSRIGSLLRAFWILRGARQHARSLGTIVIANTMELLVLCWLSGLTRLPTVYDVADIHVLLLSPSIPGRLARWLERHAMRRAQLLVVTSPWFYWEYFRRWQRTDRKALLIENRVARSAGSEVAGHGLRARIAWNGLLRCQRSASVLLQCLSQVPAPFHLSLHGSLARLEALGPLLAHSPNCTYTGPYRPESLGTLVADSSFMWAVDYADGENSRWLLPNRLYEAIDSAVPLIAVQDSATGAVVRHYDIGIVLPECTGAALTQALRECTPAGYDTWVRNMQGLKSRAQRGNEWQRVFEQDGDWSAFAMLPDKPDVSVVLQS
jgi:succinoglycan biosynthesis protein ExoL